MITWQSIRLFTTALSITNTVIVCRAESRFIPEHFFSLNHQEDNSNVDPTLDRNLSIPLLPIIFISFAVKLR